MLDSVDKGNESEKAGQGADNVRQSGRARKPKIMDIIPSIVNANVRIPSHKTVPKSSWILTSGCPIGAWMIGPLNIRSFEMGAVYAADFKDIVVERYHKNSSGVLRNNVIHMCTQRFASFSCWVTPKADLKEAEMRGVLSGLMKMRATPWLS